MYGSDAAGSLSLIVIASRLEIRCCLFLERFSFFLGNVEQRKKQLLQKTNFITLENGYFPHPHGRNGTDYNKIEIPALKQVLDEYLSLHNIPYEYDEESAYIDSLDEIEMSLEEMEESKMDSIYERTPYTRDLTIIAEPDIPMKTIQRVISTTIRNNFGAIIAGWKDGRIQGVLPKPVEAYQKPASNLWPSPHPMYCDVHISPTKGWVSCGNAPPITTNKDCSNPNWKSIMKDLAFLNEQCPPYWKKHHRYVMDWPTIEDSGIEIFPYVTGDLTFRALVEQMEIAYDAYPAVHQGYYPLLSKDKDTIHHDGCAYSLDVQTLNKEQLKAMCTLAGEHTIDRAFPGYFQLLNRTSKEEKQ